MPFPRGLLRGIRLAGLRWRLTAWVGAMMVISFGAIFFVVYRDTGSQIHSQINRDITSDVHQLDLALRLARGRDPAQLSAAATRYVRAQPYSASSPLLFAIISGAPTASNHPELFGSRVTDSGETVAEQAAENAESRPLRVPHLAYSPQLAPDL